MTMPEGQMKEVVVIDDSQEVCEALATFIRMDGYSTSTFTDGRDALQYVRDGARPCLILIDMRMPEFDGWDFLGELSRFLTNVPAFLMSAETKIDAAKAAAFGAIGILQKPFDLGRLTEILSHHCHGMGQACSATSERSV